MLCQVCLQAEATIHVRGPTAGEPPVESDYCHTCYHIKYANRPPAGPPAFPLKRFTIKGLMIVAGLFAILNAAVVLYMRSGPVTGTPAQIRDRTLRALLIDNLCLAVLLSEFLVLSWLEKLARYRKTGSATPMVPRTSKRRTTDHLDFQSNASPRERVFQSLFCVWSVLCVVPFLVRTLDSSSWVFSLNLGRLLALLLTMIGVWALLLCGLVDSTRRR